MLKILEKISSLVTADNIALLSVIITVLIFVISRRAEMRYKKHDDKKIQYIKLIALLEKTFTGTKKDKKGELILTDEHKRLFFDAGSSLLLYGSKKLYKQYLFFREFSSNPLVKQSKYYDNGLAIYLIANILITMRKEVGLSNFSNIQSNEALGFFVNDISSNPIAKEKAIDAKYRIRMIKFELFMVDRTRFIFFKSLYSITIKPLLSGLKICFKYIIAIPLGRLMIKLFPKFTAKLQNSHKE